MIETLYTVALLTTVLTNGVAIAGARPLRDLFAPLRERRIIIGALAVDVILVPAVVVIGSIVLGLDEMTRAALVIVAASSTGPIGIALARVARGDVALGVSLVTALGVLNVITVPLVTGLLLPKSIQLPLGPVVSTLVVLVVVPLAVGRLWARVASRPRTGPDLHRRGLVAAARVSNVSLLIVLFVALLFDPVALLEAWSGPIMLVAAATMALVALASRALTGDPARRRTLVMVMNARAVALGLTLVALYLPEATEVRTTVLAFGGIMQVVPIAVAAATRRWSR